MADNQIDEGTARQYQDAPKLTEWANEPTLQTLSDDWEASKQSHNEMVAKVDRWSDLLHVTGAAKPKPVKNRSNVQPRLVRRQAEWRYAALTEPFLSSDKLFDVKPATFESVKAALQNETVLNWQWRTKLQRVKFIDEYVRSAVDEGTVITKVSWMQVKGMVPKMVPVWAYYPVQDEEQLMALQEAEQLAVNAPDEFSMLPEDIQESYNYSVEAGQAVWAVQEGEQEIMVEGVIENRPMVQLVNPRNFFADPSCQGDLDNAMFVVQSFETCQADLRKQSDRYKNLDYVDWASADPAQSYDHATTTPTNFNFKDNMRKRVLAYEYWGYYDVNGDGVLVPIVATWIGKTLIRLEENPFPDQKIPYVIESYMPVKRELFGEADAELLGDNQAVLGALMRGMIDLLGRSANSQQGFAKGFLDFANRRKFDNGQDYEFNPGQGTPQTSHIEHTYPEIPASAMNMVMMQNNEAEALTGVKAFAGGVSGEAFGDVAAGIRGVLDAASKREMGILRRMANGLKKIGEKVIAMNQVFMSEEETVQVTDEEFVQVKREDLQGQFDLIVDISTAEIDNKKAQDLAFMLQTMGNTVDFNIVKMLLVQIARLQRMPELAKMLEEFEPEPDPFEEQMKQLQVEEQQLKNALLQSEIELNQAKAQKELQIADKTNLDIVETETGTKHEREMAKSRGQAEGNQDLELTKALLKPRKEGEGEPDIEAGLGFTQLTKAANNSGNVIPRTFGERDALAQSDPRMNIGSSYYDPALDPASNAAINM